MKKFFALLTILATLTTLTTLSQAAGISSGGQTTTPPPPPPAPATAPAPASAPVPIAAPEPIAAPSPTPTPKTTKAPVTAPIAATAKHCGEKSTLEERVKCRLEADAKTIQLEHDTAYFPEGCRRGNAEWQNACKARYKLIGPCWYDNKNINGDKYPYGEVASCLKAKLKLPEVLMPVADYCKGKTSSCSEDYKKAVHNLIIARFYDAEQRAEILYAQKKISEQDTIDFVTFISQSKLDFYDAKTKEERVKVIQNVISKWQQLVKKINS